MRNWKKWLSTVLFVALVAGLGWYLYQNRADLSQLLSLDFGTVCWMLVLALGACTLNALYHKIILDTHRIQLDVVDWMGVVFVANAMAYILPMRADLVFSATYYKRTKGLEYVKSASIAAGNIVFSILFILVQMLAALLCTGLIQNVWPGVLWLAWGVGALGTAAFLVLTLFFHNRMPAFLKRIPIVQRVMEGFCNLLTDRKLLGKLLVCLTANNLLHLLLYIACFRSIGMEVTLYQALFYNSISRMLTLVAIVPGNIGIHQAVMGVAGSLMGDVFQQGVMVSLLHSVVLLVIYIAAAAVFAYPVWRKWNLKS